MEFGLSMDCCLLQFRSKGWVLLGRLQTWSFKVQAMPRKCGGKVSVNKSWDNDRVKGALTVKNVICSMWNGGKKALAWCSALPRGKSATQPHMQSTMWPIILQCGKRILFYMFIIHTTALPYPLAPVQLAVILKVITSQWRTQNVSDICMQGVRKPRWINETIFILFH